eukprot:Hpha_TRINITY_DN15646_c0_g1::TRINITY_DN15646_c0_g1_i1::g.100144::m.100144
MMEIRLDKPGKAAPKMWSLEWALQNSPSPCSKVPRDDSGCRMVEYRKSEIYELGKATVNLFSISQDPEEPLMGMFALQEIPSNGFLCEYKGIVLKPEQERTACPTYHFSVDTGKDGAHTIDAADDEFSTWSKRVNTNLPVARHPIYGDQTIGLLNAKFEVVNYQGRPRVMLRSTNVIPKDKEILAYYGRTPWGVDLPKFPDCLSEARDTCVLHMFRIPQLKRLLENDTLPGPRVAVECPLCQDKGLEFKSFRNWRAFLEHCTLKRIISRDLHQQAMQRLAELPLDPNKKNQKKGKVASAMATAALTRAASGGLVRPRVTPVTPVTPDADDLPSPKKTRVGDDDPYNPWERRCRYSCALVESLN